MLRNKIATGAMALGLLAIPAIAATPATGANAWTVDHSQSNLGFEGNASGQAFTGKFTKWEAAIQFDPAALAKSSAEVTIDMASVDSGDPSRDTSLPEPDWFSTTLFPQATFKTDSIRAGDAAGSYVADGTLTIRNVSKPASLPFTLTIDGDTAKMQGSLTLKRTDFGVGQNAWASPSTVALDVKVNVDVTATRSK